MSVHLHVLARWRMRRLFSSGLTPSGYAALLQEIRGCPRCASLYSRMEALENALCAPAEGPGPFALERVEAAVLQRLARPERPQTPTWRWALVPVAACSLLAAFLVLRPTQLDSGLAVRGYAPAKNAGVGIRLLRVHGPDLEENGVVSLDDLVTFTYTNAAPGMRFLALFGVQEDGRVRWYYPGYEGTASIPVSHDRVDEPLGDGIRLSVNHSPGWLRVSAVFSAEPIARDSLERAVRALAASPTQLQNLAPLPLAGGGFLEHSIRVNVVLP